MAKYISNELARLIRERSYSSGAIAMLDKEAADIAVTFVQLRQRLREIRPKRRKELARLAKIDAEITRQLSVDPEDIRPARRTPRSSGKHGAIVRAIVRVLTESGKPVQTPDIIAVVVAELGWAFDTPEVREIARRKVVRPLRVLVEKGAVIRLHDTATSNTGLWQWIGL